MTGVGLSYAGAAFIALAGDERAHFFAEVERHTTSWVCVQILTADRYAMVPSQATVVMKHLAGSSMLRHVTVRGLAEH